MTMTSATAGPGGDADDIPRRCCAGKWRCGAAQVERADLRDISWGALHLDKAQAYLEMGTPGAEDALLEAYEVSLNGHGIRGASEDGGGRCEAERNVRGGGSWEVAAGTGR